MTPTLALLLTLTAAPAPSHLAAAEEAIYGLQYEQAAAELDKARAEPLDRASLLRVLELQGLVGVSVGQNEPAQKAFRQLLYLDPGRQPPADWSPKVRTQFFEAGAWQAHHKPLSARAGPPVEKAGAVTAVTVLVDDESLHLVRKVRVRPAGGAPAEAPLAAAGPTAVPVPPAPEVRYAAELLGEHGEVLYALGDKEPLLARAAAPAAVAATAAPPPASTGPRFRAPAYALLGVGAAALIGAGVAGGLARSNWSAINDASRDGSGAVTGMSQQEAFDRASTASSERTAAYVLGGVGAAAVVAGGVLWFLGSGSESVAVGPAPAGAGLALAGRWP